MTRLMLLEGQVRAMRFEAKEGNGDYLSAMTSSLALEM